MCPVELEISEELLSSLEDNFSYNWQLLILSVFSGRKVCISCDFLMSGELGLVGVSVSSETAVSRFLLTLLCPAFLTLPSSLILDDAARNTSGGNTLARYLASPAFSLSTYFCISLPFGSFFDFKLEDLFNNTDGC